MRWKRTCSAFGDDADAMNDGLEKIMLFSTNTSLNLRLKNAGMPTVAMDARTSNVTDPDAMQA